MYAHRLILAEQRDQKIWWVSQVRIFDSTLLQFNCEIIMGWWLCSVYFESVTWDELTVGFEQPPGGPEYANRSVLSYHFYIPPQVFNVTCHFWLELFLAVIFCPVQINVDFTFAQRQMDLKRLSCAGLNFLSKLLSILFSLSFPISFIGFLTEFSIGNPDIKTMDTADEYLQVLKLLAYT